MGKANVCGDRIRQIRLKRELSQIDVSAALDVDHNIKLDRSDISEIERRMRGVKDLELIALSDILGVNPLWLLYGDKIPKFSEPALKSK